MADKTLYVQAGRACTSKKGIIVEGTKASAKDFTGGEESVKGLLKKGVLGTKKMVSEEKFEDKGSEKPVISGGAEKVEGSN